MELAGILSALLPAQATVHLACSEGRLILQIENEGTDEWVPFMPHSIMEHTAARGRRARFKRHADKGTVVLVTLLL
jgi:hypothetical protein